MFFKCHNCGQGQNFTNFLKFIDPKLHKEYLLERYKGSAPSTPEPNWKFEKPVFKINILNDCKVIKDLDDDHVAKKYLIDRKIPEEFFDKLYYTEKFQQLVNKVKPNTYKTQKDHNRIIIPFYDTTGDLFAFQGRSLGHDIPKYLTIKLNENKQKVFGLERLNFQDHVYIVEGPFDSLFIGNCIAAAGADLSLNNKVPNNRITYIFDNEPTEIIKKINEVIDLGYNVCIWNERKVSEFKDINDMIMGGLSQEEIVEIINSNTYNGLSAKTKLQEYKKI
jgi:hypothetical protein